MPARVRIVKAKEENLVRQRDRAALRSMRRALNVLRPDARVLSHRRLPLRFLFLHRDRGQRLLSSFLPRRSILESESRFVRHYRRPPALLFRLRLTRQRPVIVERTISHPRRELLRRFVGFRGSRRQPLPRFVLRLPHRRGQRVRDAAAHALARTLRVLGSSRRPRFFLRTIWRHRIGQRHPDRCAVPVRSARLLRVLRRGGRPAHRRRESRFDRVRAERQPRQRIELPIAQRTRFRPSLTERD